MMKIAWRSRLRLLPLTLVASTALAGIKVVDLWQGGRFIGVPAATAETGSRAVASGPPVKLAEAKADEKAKADERPKVEDKARTDDKARGTAPKTAAPAARDPASYTAAEIEVLQSLSKRREALDQREREMAAREALLAATEKRIESRVAELKTLEAKLTSLADKRDEEEERRLRGLVKVYESMKPQDAARIFTELDMPVLLDVAERMKEAKLAPILGQMNPQKAKAMTVELATRRDDAVPPKPEPVGAGTAPQAAPAGPKKEAPAPKADAAATKGKPS